MIYKHNQHTVLVVVRLLNCEYHNEDWCLLANIICMYQELYVKVHSSRSKNHLFNVTRIILNFSLVYLFSLGEWGIYLP